MDGHIFVLMYAILTSFQITFLFITDVSKVYGERDTLHQTEGNDECLTLHTCQYNLDRHVPYCYCDSQCHFYNDCCLDHAFKDLEQHSTKERSRANADRFECVQMLASPIGVYYVTTCPNSPMGMNSSSHLKNTEESTFDVLPVTAQDNTVYKNMHIALCNNETNFTFWNILFDLSSCIYGIEETQISNKSSSADLEEFLFRHGCDYKVIPKENTTPRFCFVFIEPNTCGNSSLRIPVQTLNGLFRNRECCKKYMDWEGGEEECDRYTCNFILSTQMESLWATRYPYSMHVLFRHKGQIEAKDGRNSGKTHTNIDTVFRNTVFNRLMSINTSVQFDVAQWRRAVYFFQLCIERALRDFSPILEYMGGTYLQTDKGSDEQELTQYIDIRIRNDLHSYELISEISTWLDGLKVRYDETNENETIEFEMAFHRVASLALCASVNSHSCYVFGYINKLAKDKNDVLQKMRASIIYLYSSCTAIYGDVVFHKDQSTFTVQCKSTDEYVEDGKMKMPALITTKYILICVSSSFIFIIIYFERKNHLHDTIFGYSYIFLVSVSLLHQSVTTFSHYYNNPLLCDYMRLTSRGLTLLNQSIAVCGSGTFIFFTLNIKGNDYKSILKNIFLFVLMFGPTILIPALVTMFIYHFSNEQTEKSINCDFHSLEESSYTHVCATANLILVPVILISFILYVKNRHEIQLLKACQPFLLAYTTVSLTSSVLIFTGYFQNENYRHGFEWIYCISIGLQIPLLSLPVLCFR